MDLHQHMITQQRKLTFSTNSERIYIGSVLRVIY